MIKRFFDMAKKISLKSSSQFQMGCVIARKNRVIGFGFNQHKTHPKANNTYRTIHAELSAILNSGEENIVGADIYVFRAKKTGEMGSAKPCKYCDHLIKSVGIKNVFYSSDTGFQKYKCDE